MARANETLKPEDLADDLESRDWLQRYTALGWAVRNNHIENVKILVKRGAKINTPDGVSPIALAALYGNRSILEYFLEQPNVNVNETYQGYTPLFLAVWQEPQRRPSYYDESVIRILLSNGAGAAINQTNEAGETVLMYACKHNTPETVEMLVKYGATYQDRVLNWCEMNYNREYARRSREFFARLTTAK